MYINYFIFIYMNYLTRVYTMMCGKETDNVEEKEEEEENDMNVQKQDGKEKEYGDGKEKEYGDGKEKEYVDGEEKEEDILGCGCFSFLTSRKKTFAYKKNKPVICSNEINKRKQLRKYIRSLPEELKLYILSYTHQPQPPALLKDIGNFHLTYRFLFNVICKKNPRKIINRILTFYDSSILYNNISPIVARKIQIWQLNHRVTKVIDDFIIIEYPNILKLFNKDNKYILLWGILPAFFRNKYLNFLYSVMDIETDEEEQGGDAPPAFDPDNNSNTTPTPVPNSEMDTDTNPDTDPDADPDANPAPDTDTDFDTAPDTDDSPDTAPDTDDSPDTDAAPRCPVYFA